MCAPRPFSRATVPLWQNRAFFLCGEETDASAQGACGASGGRLGAHGFWGPGDFRSETPHHSHTRISTGGVTFAPLISASDAWVIFSQAHFYKDQRPSRPISGQGARPISKAGVGPIQGTGLPRLSRRCLSPPLARALLLRDPGTAPSPPLPLPMPQARSALPILDLA